MVAESVRLRRKLSSSGPAPWTKAVGAVSHEARQSGRPDKVIWSNAAAAAAAAAGILAVLGGWR